MTPSSPADPDPSSHLKRFRSDINVQGVLRLGAPFVLDGDVVAPGGVILGRDVVVEGDVFTDGEVLLGRGSRIRGRVRMLSDHPGALASADAPASGVSPASLGSQRRQGARQAFGFRTVEAMLEVLRDLVWDEDLDTGSGSDAPLGSLDRGTLRDVMEGLVDLLDEAYRPSAQGHPWSRDEVVAVLYQRVVPLILPVEATRLDPATLTLSIRRPSLDGTGLDIQGWPVRARTLVEVLTAAVDPSSSVEAAQGEGPSRAQANPEQILLSVRLGPDGSM